MQSMLSWFHPGAGRVLTTSVIAGLIGGAVLGIASIGRAQTAAQVTLPTIPDPVAVTLDTGSTALLSLDVTDSICTKYQTCLDEVPAMAAMLGQARTNNVSVIHSGSPPQVAGVTPLPGEPVVNGPGDKFFGSNLNELLQEQSITTLLIQGWAGNRAVLYTAFDGASRGYTVVVLEDVAQGATPFDTLVTQYQLLNTIGRVNQNNDPLVAGGGDAQPFRSRHLSLAPFECLEQTLFAFCKADQLAGRNDRGLGALGGLVLDGRADSEDSAEMPISKGAAPVRAEAVDQEYWSLRVFCVVAEQESVSLAAQQLSMSQSGVSMVLHRLSKRFKARLTQQAGRRVVLTPAGVELYRHALDTLRSATALESRIRFLKGESEGLVIMATRASLAEHFFPSILIEFWKQHLDVELRVVEIAPAFIVMRDVLDSGVEFAALPRGGGMVVGPDLVAEPFHREPMILVAAPDHPLARAAAPSIAEIAREPFVISAPESNQVRRLENLFHSAGAGRLRIAVEIGGDGAKELVAAGAGLAMMMECQVQDEIERGVLRPVPLAGPAPTAEFVLIYRSNQPFSQPAADMVSLIRRRGNLAPATTQ